MIADVTKSFRNYLETQKDYFDYLRNRPRFFLSTHYIDKRLVIVKTSVEEAKKEEEDGSRRRRRKKKQPSKVPVKQPVKEVEQPETVKEPVATPVPVAPVIRTPVLSLPRQETVETPAEEEVPIDEPLQTPKPPKVPVFNLDKLLSKAPGTHTPAEAQFLIDNGYDDFVKGGMKGTDPIGDVITLAASAVISFFAIPALLGGGGAATGTTGGVTATSKVVPFLKSGAANKIVPFARQTAPMLKFAYGGTGYGPAYSLAGERTTEVAVPWSKFGEFVQSLFREAGSIAVAAADSVTKSMPVGSAISSTISKLTSLFGKAKGFEPQISVPSQIPKLDVTDTKVDGGIFSKAIDFGKNMGAGLLSMAMSSASIVVSPSASAAPGAMGQDSWETPPSQVIVPEYDPSLQGAEITAHGVTDSTKVSGFEITSPYGPRTHPVTGEPGKLHGGIDINTPSDTPVGFNKPGEIVFAGSAGGYGYMIDAWIPSLNIQFRLAHLNSFIKKEGTFDAGEAIAKTGGAKGHPGAGSSTGPHLHLEVDKSKGGTLYGGARDAQLLGDMSKHVLLGPMSTGPKPGDPDFVGPVPQGEGEGGPDSTITSFENTQKTSQTEIVRQQRIEKLQVSRVNSIVEIPVQGPPLYTPQLTTIMREKSSKRPLIISPFSKGVEQ
tara:strand:- start:5508 stop:7493 length:1986 start_codon:yes stop_codon:yes gene_type:complete